MRRLLVVVAMVVLGSLLAGPVGAVNTLNPICDKLTDAQQKADAGCGESKDELVERMPGAINALFMIAGALAVGIIIYAAIRMVISQGDASKVAQERHTIMYAVAGLVVVLISYAVVRFIVENVGGS